MRELIAVIPVYNEAECIVEVIQSWKQVFAGLNIDFSILVLNDGSKDNTGAELAKLIKDDRVEVVNKANSGHGPTILRGYGLAAQKAEWIFQVDSDNEMSAEYFSSIWSQRSGYDFLIGIRHHRVSPLPRRLITAFSRFSVWMLFGWGITDVNCPYRLMKRQFLLEALELLPADTFAPNVIISGLALKKHLRIYQTLVPHIQRKTGKVSIVKWNLWKSAIKSFFQTIKFGFGHNAKSNDI